MAAIAVFLVGSLLCAGSTTLPMLVAARVLQGAGSAMMFPIGRMILIGAASKQDLVRVLASVSPLPALTLVIGPLLAGYVATFLDWRLLFLINVPIGVGALVLALFVVPQESDSPGTPFDGIGFVLASLASNVPGRMSPETGHERQCARLVACEKISDFSASTCLVLPRKATRYGWGLAGN